MTPLKIFRRVVLAVVVAMFGSAVTSCNRLQPSVEEVLQLTIEQVNGLTPIEVDEITRLDSASYQLPATLRYHYTLSIDSLSVAERADMEGYMRATLPDRIREEKGSEALGRLGVELQYCYFNPSGKLLLELTVAPTEYACEK